MPITVSEFAPQSTASATSVTTPSKSTTAGSAVVAFAFSSNWSSPPTPTCTVGGSAATAAGTATRGVGYPIFRAWYIGNIGGSSITAGVSGYDTGQISFAAVEIVGADTTSPLRGSGWAVQLSDPTGYAADSPGVGVEAGDCAIAGFCYDTPASAASWTPPSGWTALTSPADQGQAVRLAYKVFGSASAGERALATTSGSGTWYESFLIVIKEAAATSSLTGDATLDGLSASGSMAPQPQSDLTGSATLDGLSAAGSMAMAPGTLTVPELRNWAGMLLTSQLVENIVVIRMSDRTLLCAFTNQTTDGTTANLALSHAALAAGTLCMVVGYNPDGSARFARPVTVV